MDTHRLQSSSFLGLPYGILNINRKKELQRRLSVVTSRVKSRITTPLLITKHENPRRVGV